MIYFTINFWLSGFLFSHLPLFILIAWLISSLSFISPDEVLWMDWSRKLDWEHCDQEQQSEALPLFLSQRVPAWTGYQAGRPLWAPVPRSTHLWNGKSFKSATFSLHLTLEVILKIRIVNLLMKPTAIHPLFSIWGWHGSMRINLCYKEA